MFRLLRTLDWSSITNWDDLERGIGMFNSQQERGEAFEEFCFAFLQLRRDFFQATQIWRFHDLPDDVLSKLGCSSRQDRGIDGVLLHNDRTLTTYQAKFRLDQSDIPTQKELSTFYMLSDRADFRLVIANVDDLPLVARERKNHGHILVDTLLTLEPSFFESLNEYIFHNRTKPQTALQPRGFHEQAIKAIIEGFAEHSRGQAILPCGSGKTLIGKWIADRMQSKRILVMVPSLALIRQTLQEWYRVKGEGFRYVCVCSDESIAALHTQDSWEDDPSELEIRVSTDASDLVAFLQEATPLPQVVFSTCQSSPVLVEALRHPGLKGWQFDLVICDEAHRVAGIIDKTFSQVLRNDLIAASKRLFMTATPKVMAPQRQNSREENPILLYSMDDQKIFGPTFYRLSFAEAISEKIISDYRIVVIGVSEQEIARIVRSGEIIQTDDAEQWNAEGLAQRIALGKAITRYGIKKIFSFHNRVHTAKRFTDARQPDSLPVVLDRMSPGLHYMANHVNGEMPTSVRTRVLREFQMSLRGVISNARCLGEGVNVPVVDGVFFADPRDSVIDIVQATGRALRMIPGKDMAYVIIPVLVQEEEDPSLIIEESRFEMVWKVLSAMISQDEQLDAIIREARIRQGARQAPVKGSLGPSGGGDLPSAKTVLMGFPLHISFPRLQSLFSLEMMEQFGNRWYLKFGALKKYMEEHAKEPQRDEEYEGFRIGAWLEAQRAAYKKGKLSEDREELLERLGITWGAYHDSERSWVLYMAACSTFFEATGKLPSQGDESSDGLKIGVWLNYQRRLFRKGRLREDREQALVNLLGDVLDPVQKRWERNFSALKDYMEETRKQPQRRTIHNGIAIGNWLINTIRPNKAKLKIDQVSQLEALGISFASTSRTTRPSMWDRNISALKQFVNAKGKLPSRYEYYHGIAVGSWLAEKVLPHKNRFTQEQVTELNALGVSFEAQSAWSKSTQPANLPQNRQFDFLTPQDKWFEYYHLTCEYLSWIQASMGSEDFHKGKYIGQWFFREQRLYNEMLLSTGKHLLFGVLLRLQKSRGLSARRWWRMYALCSEFILISPNVFTEIVTYCDERIGKWYEEQMPLFKKERLDPEQQVAMKELIRLSLEKSQYRI